LEEKRAAKKKKGFQRKFNRRVTEERGQKKKTPSGYNRKKEDGPNEFQPREGSGWEGSREKKKKCDHSMKKNGKKKRRTNKQHRKERGKRKKEWKEGTLDPSEKLHEKKVKRQKVWQQGKRHRGCAKPLEKKKGKKPIEFFRGKVSQERVCKGKGA